MFSEYVVFEKQPDNKNNKNEIVAYTAALETLYMLAESKNEDALKYIEFIENEQLFTNKSEIVKRKKKNRNRINLMFGATLILENRYKLISNLIQNSKCKNILDIACGYTPRAYSVARQGINYVGIDVIGVIDTIEPIVVNLLENKEQISYICGDILNSEIVISASNYLNGELFILSDGILQNFTVNEMNNFINTIKLVLNKHGGAWYTSDFETTCDTITAIYFNCEDSYIKNLADLRPIIEKSKLFFEEYAETEERIKFIENYGIVIEKIPLYSDKIELNTLQKVSGKKKEKIISELKKNYIWKMTLM